MTVNLNAHLSRLHMHEWFYLFRTIFKLFLLGCTPGFVQLNLQVQLDRIKCHIHGLMILGASHCPRRDPVKYCWFSWPPRHDLTCLFLFDFPEGRRLPLPGVFDEMFWLYRRLYPLPCWFRFCNMHGNGFVPSRRNTISVSVHVQWCCFWVSARACVRFSPARKFDFIFCQ